MSAYKTSYSAYGPKEENNQCGTSPDKEISDLAPHIGERQVLSRPPLGLASAPFPMKPDSNISYPRIDKVGVENPMFFTTSMEVGANKPLPHHLPDRYFPKSNNFSQSFANRQKPFAGLVTHVSHSRIHNSFDRF